MFCQALQFNCCSPESVMGETCCKLEAFPWHCWPIYVWIFQNGVEFEAKLFRLPVGDSRQGRPLRYLKRQGGSVKEGRGRKPRGLATSCYHKGAQALSPRGWGGSQRVTFCPVKLPIFFVGQPWSDMPC